MAEHETGQLSAADIERIASGGETKVTESAPEATSSEAPESTTPSTPDFSTTKHRVKIDGKDTEVDYNELVRGYSHQSAASKRYNEAQELRKQADTIRQQYETAISNLNYLAATNPAKVIEILGIDPAELVKRREAERERIESMPPEERVKGELLGEISNLKRELMQLKGSQEQLTQQQVNSFYEQRFTELSGKYPEANPQYVAFICSQNPELEEEQVFKAEHENAIKQAEERFKKYRDKKKEDAKNTVLSSGGIPSLKKDTTKLSHEETANLLMEMYGIKKGASW